MVYLCDYKIEEFGLRFPLSAIRNLGINAINTIITERNKKKFNDIYDFISRVYRKSINKKTLESLIDASALREFGYNIHTLINALDNLISYAELVGSSDEDVVPKPNIDILEEYPKKELMQLEFDTFGFY